MKKYGIVLLLSLGMSLGAMEEKAPKRNKTSKNRSYLRLRMASGIPYSNELVRQDYSSTTVGINSSQSSQLIEGELAIQEQMIKAIETNNDEVARSILDKYPAIIRLYITHYTFRQKDYSKVTLLHIAALHDADKVAALLIDNGAIIDAAKESKGDTPLYIAALCNSNKVAALLIDNGATINATFWCDETLLHAAARSNSDKVAALLIDKGAIIDAKSWTNNTPLHEATIHNAAEVAVLLIDRGADKEARNVHGNTPLDIAAGERSITGNRQKSNLALVDILLAAGANKEGIAYLVSLQARGINKANENVLVLHERLSEKEAEDNGTLLHTIIKKEQLEALRAYCIMSKRTSRYAVENIEKEDKFGNTPMHLAANMGSVEVVTLLLKLINRYQLQNIHFKLNEAGNTPLDIAKGNMNKSLSKKEREQQRKVYNLLFNYKPLGQTGNLMHKMIKEKFAFQDTTIITQ